MNGSSLKKSITPVLFFLSITLFVMALKTNEFGPVERLEWKLQDWLHTIGSGNIPSDKIALVTIDQLAVSRFGQWPWSRERVADLIAAVGAANPKTTLVDLDLTSAPGDSLNTADSIIGEQMRWMRTVTVSYEIAPSSRPSDTITNPAFLFRNSLRTNTATGAMDSTSSLAVERVSLPSIAVCGAASHLGFTYTKVDDDNTLRWEPLIINYNGYYYPSAALSAAAEFLDKPSDEIEALEGEGVRVGDKIIPTDRNGNMLINFTRSDPGYTTYSAAEVLEEEVDSAKLAGKLVIITMGLESQTAFYNAPINPEMAQYTKLATVVDNIVSGRALSRSGNNQKLYYAILLVIGIFCGMGLPLISPLYRLLVVVFGLVTLASVNYFLFDSMNTLANPIYIAIQLILFLIACPLLGVRLNSFRKTAVEVETPASPRRVARPHGNAESGFEHNNATLALRTGASATDTSALAGADFNATVALGAAGIGSDNDMNRTIAIGGASAGQQLDRTTAFTASSDANSDSSDDTQYGTMALGSAPSQSSSGASGSGSVGGGYNFDEPLELEKPQTASSRDENADALKSMVSTPTPAPFAPARQSVASEALTDADEAERTRLFGAISATSASISAAPAPRPVDVPVENMKKLGRYLITGVLGKGAMGTVYEGVDPAINRPVALKTIRLDFMSDPAEMGEMKERLFMEAQAAGRMSHPNIVVIYDVGSEGTTQYIAMERLHGRTLEDLLKSKANFNYRIVAKMVSQICMALQYAHEQGIVHRDIKPANIMVLPDYSIKVMDFGIARVESSSMTKTGVAMGTPNYISPEQLQGKGVDGRSDIFSLGVVIYELLVGARPFKGDNISTLIYSIMNHEPPAPSRVNPRVPPLFDHVALKALKKDPQQRFQKASDVAQALSDFVGSFVSR